MKTKGTQTETGSLGRSSILKKRQQEEDFKGPCPNLNPPVYYASRDFIGACPRATARLLAKPFQTERVGLVVGFLPLDISTAQAATEPLLSTPDQSIPVITIQKVEGQIQLNAYNHSSFLHIGQRAIALIEFLESQDQADWLIDITLQQLSTVVVGVIAFHNPQKITKAYLRITPNHGQVSSIQAAETSLEQMASGITIVSPKENLVFVPNLERMDKGHFIFCETPEPT